MQEQYEVLERIDIIISFEKVIDPSLSLFEKFKIELIKLTTSSEYFHTEIAIGDKWYSFGQKGLVTRDLKPLNDKYDYVKVSKTVSAEQKEQLDEFLALSAEYDYDWKAIFFTFGIKMGGDKTEDYTCGEYVTKILQILTVKEVLYKQAHKNSPKMLCDDLKYSYEYIIK